MSNIEDIVSESEKLGGATDFPFKFWLNATKERQHIDLFVILSDMIISKGGNDIERDDASVSNVLNRYRQTVNPEMTFVEVNLCGYGAELPLEEDPENPHTIRICGYSDSILRLISERQVSQVQYIKEFSQKIRAASLPH